MIDIEKIVGRKLTARQSANWKSVATALDGYGARFGLDKPHRLAHFIAQLMHESAGFQYDKEIASGAAYEGRRDLGNTKPGDGKRFKGRGPIQITGRANYSAFTKWARAFDRNAPDFTATPEAVNTDPWEGLAPIWYWDEGNPDPQNRSLNWYADKNNIEMITRRINGGLNGYSDRLHWYDRTALVMLGYGPDDVRKFQTDAKRRGDYKTDVDGQSGPMTRTALHIALMGDAIRDKGTAIAPVTEEKQVVPPKVETEVKRRTGWWEWLTGGGGVGTLGVGALAGLDRDALIAGAVILIVVVTGIVIFRRQIIAAIKDVRAEVQA